MDADSHEANMKVLSIIFVCLLYSSLSAHDVSAKQWRGVVPLQSTRADIVRLFKTCEKGGEGCSLQVGNERVSIVFSGEAISRIHDCAKTLPSETVLLIEVELVTPVSHQGT